MLGADIWVMVAGGSLLASTAWSVIEMIRAVK